MTSQPGPVQRLIELGFSQYEAQAYVGRQGLAIVLRGPRAMLAGPSPPTGSRRDRPVRK